MGELCVCVLTGLGPVTLLEKTYFSFGHLSGVRGRSQAVANCPISHSSLSSRPGHGEMDKNHLHVSTNDKMRAVYMLVVRGLMGGPNFQIV